MCVIERGKERSDGGAGRQQHEEGLPACLPPHHHLKLTYTNLAASWPFTWPWRLTLAWCAAFSLLLSHVLCERSHHRRRWRSDEPLHPGRSALGTDGLHGAVLSGCTSVCAWLGLDQEAAEPWTSSIGTLAFPPWPHIPANCRVWNLYSKTTKLKVSWESMYLRPLFIVSFMKLSFYFWINNNIY